MIQNSNIIDKKNEWIDRIKEDSTIIHLAFLEIFIEFEKFMREAFIGFCLGEQGKNLYKPTLRLEFDNKEHLIGLLKYDKQYIDYIKIIPLMKQYFFKKETCPFSKVLSDSKFNTYFKQMQTLRNFIAHQSEESKDKYINSVLKANNINTYIKANTFLNKTNKNNQTYYSLYIEILSFYSDIICDPREIK